MNKDGMGRFIVVHNQSPTPVQQIIYYLYGSGFAAADKTNRTERILKCTQGEAKERMLSIIREESYQVGNGALCGLWMKVQLAILRYGELDGAKTIFHGKKIPYVGHLQSSKNCYLHASSTMVGYKVALSQESNNTYKAVSVDVAKLVRHAYHDGNLERRVVYNKGGRSKSLLKQLLIGSQTKISSYSLHDEDDVINAFKKIRDQGPCLASRFIVDNFFRNMKSLSPPDDGKIYIHQFDRLKENNDEKDNHNFVTLGKPTDDDLNVINNILDANTSVCVPGSTFNNTASPIVPEIVTSTSTDTTSMGIPGIIGIATSISTDASVSSGLHDEDNKNEEMNLGLHAMVVIGYRTMDNKHWFLLQNTWKMMPLLEVSCEYLMHKLEGDLVFISGNLPEAPSAVDIRGGLFCEGDFDDGGEDREEVEGVNDSDLED